jgi:hypothetical protein
VRAIQRHREVDVIDDGEVPTRQRYERPRWRRRKHQCARRFGKSAFRRGSPYGLFSTRASSSRLNGRRDLVVVCEVADLAVAA